MARRKYDREFKREAARLVIEDGRTVRSVENSLGITRGVLKDWVHLYRKDSESAFVGSGRLLPEAEKVRQLQRENERLRRERDILKKAAAYFSRDALNDLRS